MLTMAVRRRRFILMEQNSPGPALQREFGDDEWITVHDRTLHVATDIRAGDFSPYRHYLQLEGRLFRAIAIEPA
jgi:hypothetical protein